MARPFEIPLCHTNGNSPRVPACDRRFVIDHVALARSARLSGCRARIRYLEVTLNGSAAVNHEVGP
jgi:hypothetical protein